MNCALVELVGGQKVRVNLIEKMKVIEEEGEGREARWGGEGGGALQASALCQQLVSVATSKKSLSLIDTVEGSGVFNCIISFSSLSFSLR